MKRKRIGLVLVLFVLLVNAVFAQDQQIGVTQYTSV